MLCNFHGLDEYHWPGYKIPSRPGTIPNLISLQVYARTRARGLGIPGSGDHAHLTPKTMSTTTPPPNTSRLDWKGEEEEEEEEEDMRGRRCVANISATPVDTSACARARPLGRPPSPPRPSMRSRCECAIIVISERRSGKIEMPLLLWRRSKAPFLYFLPSLLPCFDSVFLLRSHVYEGA